MKYREVNFKKRKPYWGANNYFYVTHTSFGHVFSMDKGYRGHMESHLKKYPDHSLTWLEPESEWDKKYEE